MGSNTISENTITFSLSPASDFSTTANNLLQFTNLINPDIAFKYPIEITLTDSAGTIIAHSTAYVLIKPKPITVTVTPLTLDSG